MMSKGQTITPPPPEEAPKERLLPKRRGYVGEYGRPTDPIDDEHTQTFKPNTPLNELNDTYLEVSTKKGGNPMWVVPFLFTSVSPFIVLFAQSFYKSSGDWVGYIMIIVFLIVGFIGLYSMYFIPRDMPIRFNRARQKVYVSFYKLHWLFFIRRHYKVYDWANTRAEVYKFSGIIVSAHGAAPGPKTYTLVFTFVDPDTNKVVKRVDVDSSQDFAATALFSGTWLAVRHYMKHGVSKQIVYKQPFEPNNTKNVFMQLRPLTLWPQELDKESRTANDDEPTPPPRFDEAVAKKRMWVTRVWMTVLMLIPSVLAYYYL